MGVGRNKFQGLKYFEIEIQKRRKPAAEINKNYYIRNFCERSEQFFLRYPLTFSLSPPLLGKVLCRILKRWCPRRQGWCKKNLRARRVKFFFAPPQRGGGCNFFSSSSQACNFLILHRHGRRQK